MNPFHRTSNKADLKAANAYGYEIGQRLGRLTFRAMPFAIVALVSYRKGKKK